VNVPPTITQQPQSRAAAPGAYAEFNVGASGTGLQYQWQRNQTDLPGETNHTIGINNVGQTDFGAYRVIVSNAGGSVTSDAAQLTLAVSPDLAIPTLNSGSFALTFDTEIGPIYAVEYKANLDDPLWVELVRTNGTGAPVTITADCAANSNRFYRLQLH